MTCFNPPGRIRALAGTFITGQPPAYLVCTLQCKPVAIISRSPNWGPHRQSPNHEIRPKFLLGLLADSSFFKGQEKLPPLASVCLCLRHTSVMNSFYGARGFVVVVFCRNNIDIFRVL
ncbi:MAG: hypothetical protein OEZ59_00840 [Deltaproteobacteria bacterium]|nr:hypothetical protein [Deltaproteobacteria bacterium]